MKKTHSSSLSPEKVRVNKHADGRSRSHPLPGYDVGIGTRPVPSIELHKRKIDQSPSKMKPIQSTLSWEKPSEKLMKQISQVAVAVSLSPAKYSCSTSTSKSQVKTVSSREHPNISPISSSPVKPNLANTIKTSSSSIISSPSSFIGTSVKIKTGSSKHHHSGVSSTSSHTKLLSSSGTGAPHTQTQTKSPPGKLKDLRNVKSLPGIDSSKLINSSSHSVPKHKSSSDAKSASTKPGTSVLSISTKTNSGHGPSKHSHSNSSLISPKTCVVTPTTKSPHHSGKPLSSSRLVAHAITHLSPISKAATTPAKANSFSPMKVSPVDRMDVPKVRTSHSLTVPKHNSESNSAKVKKKRVSTGEKEKRMATGHKEKKIPGGEKEKKLSSGEKEKNLSHLWKTPPVSNNPSKSGNKIPPSTTKVDVRFKVDSKTDTNHLTPSSKLSPGIATPGIIFKQTNITKAPDHTKSQTRPKVSGAEKVTQSKQPIPSVSGGVVSVSAKPKLMSQHDLGPVPVIRIPKSSTLTVAQSNVNPGLLKSTKAKELSEGKQIKAQKPKTLLPVKNPNKLPNGNQECSGIKAKPSGCGANVGVSNHPQVKQIPSGVKKVKLKMKNEMNENKTAKPSADLSSKNITPTKKLKKKDPSLKEKKSKQAKLKKKLPKIIIPKPKPKPVPKKRGIILVRDNKLTEAMKKRTMRLKKLADQKIIAQRKKRIHQARKLALMQAKMKIIRASTKDFRLRLINRREKLKYRLRPTKSDAKLEKMVLNYLATLKKNTHKSDGNSSSPTSSKRKIPTLKVSRKIIQRRLHTLSHSRRQLRKSKASKGVKQPKGFGLISKHHPRQFLRSLDKGHPTNNTSTVHLAKKIKRKYTKCLKQIKDRLKRPKLLAKIYRIQLQKNKIRKKSNDKKKLKLKLVKGTNAKLRGIILDSEANQLRVLKSGHKKLKKPLKRVSKSKPESSHLKLKRILKASKSKIKSAKSSGAGHTKSKAVTRALKKKILKHGPRGVENKDSKKRMSDKKLLKKVVRKRKSKILKQTNKKTETAEKSEKTKESKKCSDLSTNSKISPGLHKKTTKRKEQSEVLRRSKHKLEVKKIKKISEMRRIKKKSEIRKVKKRSEHKGKTNSNLKNGGKISKHKRSKKGSEINLSKKPPGIVKQRNKISEIDKKNMKNSKLLAGNKESGILKKVQNKPANIQTKKVPEIIKHNNKLSGIVQKNMKRPDILTSNEKPDSQIKNKNMPENMKTKKAPEMVTKIKDSLKNGDKDDGRKGAPLTNDKSQLTIMPPPKFPAPRAVKLVNTAEAPRPLKPDVNKLDPIIRKHKAGDPILSLPTKKLKKDSSSSEPSKKPKTNPDSSNTFKKDPSSSPSEALKKSKDKSSSKSPIKILETSLKTKNKSPSSIKGGAKKEKISSTSLSKKPKLNATTTNISPKSGNPIKKKPVVTPTNSGKKLITASKNDKVDYLKPKMKTVIANQKRTHEKKRSSISVQKSKQFSGVRPSATHPKAQIKQKAGEKIKKRSLAQKSKSSKLPAPVKSSTNKTNAEKVGLSKLASKSKSKPKLNAKSKPKSKAASGSEKKQRKPKLVSENQLRCRLALHAIQHGLKVNGTITQGSGKLRPNPKLVVALPSRPAKPADPFGTGLYVCGTWFPYGGELIMYIMRFLRAWRGEIDRQKMKELSDVVIQYDEKYLRPLEDKTNFWPTENKIVLGKPNPLETPNVERLPVERKIESSTNEVVQAAVSVSDHDLKKLEEIRHLIQAQLNKPHEGKVMLETGPSRWHNALMEVEKYTEAGYRERQIEFTPSVVQSPSPEIKQKKEQPKLPSFVFPRILETGPGHLKLRKPIDYSGPLTLVALGQIINRRLSQGPLPLTPTETRNFIDDLNLKFSETKQRIPKMTTEDILHKLKKIKTKNEASKQRLTKAKKPEKVKKSIKAQKNMGKTDKTKSVIIAKSQLNKPKSVTSSSNTKSEVKSSKKKSETKLIKTTKSGTKLSNTKTKTKPNMTNSKSKSSTTKSKAKPTKSGAKSKTSKSKSKQKSSKPESKSEARAKRRFWQDLNAQVPITQHSIELLEHLKKIHESKRILKKNVYHPPGPLPKYPAVVRRKIHKRRHTLLSEPQVDLTLSQQIYILAAQAGYDEVRQKPVEILMNLVKNFCEKFAKNLKEVTERAMVGAPYGFSDPMENVLMQMGVGGTEGLYDWYNTNVLDYRDGLFEQCLEQRKALGDRLRSKITSKTAPKTAVNKHGQVGKKLVKKPKLKSSAVPGQSGGSRKQNEFKQNVTKKMNKIGISPTKKSPIKSQDSNVKGLNVEHAKLHGTKAQHPKVNYDKEKSKSLLKQIKAQGATLVNAVGNKSTPHPPSPSKTPKESAHTIDLEKLMDFTRRKYGIKLSNPSGSVPESKRQISPSKSKLPLKTYAILSRKKAPASNSGEGNPVYHFKLPGPTKIKSDSKSQTDRTGSGKPLKKKMKLTISPTSASHPPGSNKSSQQPALKLGSSSNAKAMQAGKSRLSHSQLISNGQQPDFLKQKLPRKEAPSKSGPSIDVAKSGKHQLSHAPNGQQWVSSKSPPKQGSSGTGINIDVGKAVKFAEGMLNDRAAQRQREQENQQIKKIKKPKINSNIDAGKSVKRTTHESELNLSGQKSSSPKKRVEQDTSGVVHFDMDKIMEAHEAMRAQQQLELDALDREKNNLKKKTKHTDNQEPTGIVEFDLDRIAKAGKAIRAKQLKELKALGLKPTKIKKMAEYKPEERQSGVVGFDMDEVTKAAGIYLDEHERQMNASRQHKKMTGHKSKEGPGSSIDVDLAVKYSEAMMAERAQRQLEQDQEDSRKTKIKSKHKRSMDKCQIDVNKVGPGDRQSTSNHHQARSFTEPSVNLSLASNFQVDIDKAVRVGKIKLAEMQNDLAVRCAPPIILPPLSSIQPSDSPPQKKRKLNKTVKKDKRFKSEKRVMVDFDKILGNSEQNPKLKEGHKPSLTGEGFPSLSPKKDKVDLQKSNLLRLNFEEEELSNEADDVVIFASGAKP